MRFLFVAVIAFILSGCASPYRKYAKCYDTGKINAAQYFTNSNHSASDNLIESIPFDNALGMSNPIIVASFVGIDGLKSTRFGKTVAEHFATRLTNKGYRIIELKLRNNVFIQNKEGEFLLSRELKDIMKNHNAQAALVGIYSESSDFVYLTAKLINLSNGISISSTDYHLCKDTDITYLLSKPANRDLTD